MRPSLRLGSIGGIRIGLHWSIALMAVVFTMLLTGSVLPAAAPGYVAIEYVVAALATTGLFLASIIAHELGHSAIAELGGLRVRGITLFALGGVAAFDSEPRSPISAAAIALAGPAVSVVIGVSSLAGAWVATVLALPTLIWAGLMWLGVINLLLAAFNLLPALPLDGGRVVQAALWHCHGNRHRATITAARIGGWLGWAIVAAAAWQLLIVGSGTAGIWTALLGSFIILTARSEADYARLALDRADALRVR